MLIVYTPENPIKTRYSFFSEKEIKNFTPQGWSFFTKSPKLEEVYLYKVDTINQKIKKVILRNTQLSQLFGIRRDNRLIITKINKITSDIDKDFWVNNNENINVFLKDKTKYDKLNKISIATKKPSICGLYCVILKKPVPWSWINLKVNMESKLILINFKCQ